MLDDIDYSALQGTTEAPKAKPTVSDRSVVKKEKLERKRIDEEKLGQSADKLLESMGEPSTGDSLTEYALPAIGVLGALSAAYAAWKKGQSSADYSKQKPGEFSVPADQKGTQAVQSVEKNVAEAATVDKLEQLQQRVEAGRAAGINQTTVQGGVTPPAAPAPVPAPVAPQPIAQAPVTATEAVATGQSPSKAIQLDVAQQLDAASAEPEIKGAVKPKGRPAGAKNLTPEQKSMIKVGEQAAGGRNWLVNQFGADPAAYEKYIAQFNKGMDYPDYKTAVASLSENLEGPPKQAFKKAVKPPSSQAGFVNVSAPTQLTPLGQGVANVGRQVVGDLKMGAAMVPFMLSTDVRQQDVGYKRELQDQLKQEKDPARAQTLKNELDKLEEGRYLQAMYNRFVQKNTMQQYRPALTR